MRGDIGTRKQDRVVRLDLGQQGHISPSSIVELERQLADAFRTTFAARQAAYDDEVSIQPYASTHPESTPALICRQHSFEL